MKRLRLLLLSAATVAATAVGVQLAAATTFNSVGPLVQVSGTGPSPFTSCALDDVAGQSGTNFPNSEVEPWIDDPSSAFFRRVGP